MDFTVLDLDDVTEEELLAAISDNIKTARLMASEIDKLRKTTSTIGQSQEQETKIAKEKQNNIDNQNIDKAFEDEVAFYYQQLLKATIEELESDDTEILPETDDYQYQRILYRLKAEVMKNIKEIRDVVADEGMTIEEAIEFKDDLLLEQKRLALIDKGFNSNEKEEEQPKEEAIENKIIFVPTTSGNIQVLEEIEHIDPAYYNRFLSLFQSIKNGTFKKYKRFSGNSELTGLSQVKAFKVRVAFVRLQDNYYAAITAFTKKDNNNLGYRTTLEKKYRDFLAIKGTLKNNLLNAEFLALNEQYEQELFSILSRNTTKDSPVVKEKVVNENV